MTGMDHDQFRTEIRKSAQELEALRSRIAHALYLRSTDEPHYRQSAQFIAYLFSMMADELSEMAGQNSKSVKPTVSHTTASVE